MTICDPSRPGRPADVLEAVGAPRSTRRTLLVLSAGILLLAGTTVAQQVRERRSEAAEQRRERAVVDLLTVRGANLGLEEIRLGGRDAATTRTRFGVRNQGPLPVTVVTGSLGDLELARAVSLDPGAEAQLVLEASARCATRPALLTLPERVALRVRSGDGVERSTSLPTPLGQDDDLLRSALARACGYLEPQEAVFLELQPGPVMEQADRLRLAAVLSNSGRGPVTVTALSAAEGFALSATDPGGAAVSLPLLLPSRGEDTEPSRLGLDLVLRLTDCASVEPGDRGLAPVQVELADVSGDITLIAYQLPDPSSVDALLDAVC